MMEKVPVSEIWTDFTVESQVEGAIKDVEEAFRAYLGHQDVNPKVKIYGVAYFLRFYDEESGDVLEKLKFPKRASEILRRIFMIKGPLAFCAHENEQKSNIELKIIPSLLSILKAAAMAAGFEFPVFIAERTPENCSFRGFALKGGVSVNYISHYEYVHPERLESLPIIVDHFACTFKQVSSIEASARIQYKVHNVKEDEIAKLRVSDFYAKNIGGFIDTARFWAEWPVVADTKAPLEILEAGNYGVWVRFKKAPERYTSKLHRFIGLLKNIWEICPGLKNWSDLTRDADKDMSKEVQEMFASIPEQSPTEKSVLKASPNHSLLHHLAIKLVGFADDVQSLALFWLAFLKEVRQAFEKKRKLPGVDDNGPDFDNCLIYQKLQMLNVCINGGKPHNDGDDKPRESEMKLMNGEPMMIPASQQGGILTEDQIMDEQVLLENNVTDQRQKAYLQRAALMRDMIAFKEINSGACFVDFIRWYSPRDYNPETNELSIRMSSSDNLWREFWEDVENGKAQAEKFSFNPVEQAEMAIDYLEGISPPELIGDLIPVLLSAAYFAFRETLNDKLEVQSELTTASNALLFFNDRVEKSDKTLDLNEYMEVSTAACNIIEECAWKVDGSNALLSLFNNPELVNLLIGPSVHAFIASTESHRELIRTLITALNIPDWPRHANFTEYSVTGLVHSTRQRIYVGDRKHEKYVVATSFADPM